MLRKFYVVVDSPEDKPGVHADLQSDYSDEAIPARNVEIDNFTLGLTFILTVKLWLQPVAAGSPTLTSTLGLLEARKLSSGPTLGWPTSASSSGAKALFSSSAAAV